MISMYQYLWQLAGAQIIIDNMSFLTTAAQHQQKYLELLDQYCLPQEQ